MLHLVSNLLGVSAIAGQATALFAEPGSRRSLASSDMYVFAYTFQPEFCYGQTTYPGCSSPHDYWFDHFTVHGLWPQFKSGGYAHDCTSEPFDDSVTDAIGFETMTTFWPDVKFAESDPQYTEFWVRNFIFMAHLHLNDNFCRITSGLNMEPAPDCRNSIISIQPLP